MPSSIQPTDLVKVRFQSEGMLPRGQAPRYSGVFNAYATIVREEGVRGLWTGLGPNIVRNSIINAAELVSYDSAKEVGAEAQGAYTTRMCVGVVLHERDQPSQAPLPSPFPQVLLLRAGLPDGLPVHLASATFAGFMATIFGNPVDVVKTRVMASRRAAAVGAGGAPSTPMYSGALDCIGKTLRAEGPRAFYQGVVPQFFRITGWNICMFVSLEQLLRLFRVVSVQAHPVTPVV